MKTMRIFLGAVLVVIAASGRAQVVDDKAFVDRQLAYCGRQVERALEGMKDSAGNYRIGRHPRKIQPEWGSPQWACYPAVPSEWTSGFWPGILWMTAEATANDRIRRAAVAYSDTVCGIAHQPIYDHDIGFLVYSPLIKAFAQTGNQTYRRAMLDAADSLATLFNPLIGTICSWPHAIEPYGWPHPTIIDNMMNLELLYWAAQSGGNSHLADIATRHAETTMRHHFHKSPTEGRGGFVAYHLAVYDTISGQFLRGKTVQGYRDSSMWSRGQAWAVYGYTMVYRFTRDKRFLRVAQGCADAYLQRLAAGDMIPYWDLDAPRPTARDASAAAIMSSALLELQGYVGKKRACRYRSSAIEMLRQLSSPEYLGGDTCVAFLRHSTGHYSAGTEVDASIIYADYYYIEALLRLKSLFANTR